MSAPGEGYGQWDTGAQAAPPPRPRNGMGIAALVLGILAILSCWTAAGGVLFGILAIVFGVIGAGRARRGVANNRGVAIAGIVTGVLGLIVGIIFVVIGIFVGFFFVSGGGQAVFQQAQQCAQQRIAQGASPQQAFEQCRQQVPGLNGG
ncbi:DUF4190 domain-containing protein [Actinomycetospora endophytica]|uniref:DUF4190 domain-containing protein n=1 Tax=Actinomycetospora endophytica TaxID=2291215 RepID=A0ABS8P6W3_9PSEU|nr:DUF4190 domain-containing protein [Actinomycetospora endophytica]MCD2193990.1 DUF4190 domain-containing protein [Actinomycetospora endophytica]